MRAILPWFRIALGTSISSALQRLLTELQEGVSNAKKRRKSSEMRKTRGMIAERSKGPKLLRDWVEEVCNSLLVSVHVVPTKKQTQRVCCAHSIHCVDACCVFVGQPLHAGTSSATLSCLDNQSPPNHELMLFFSFLSFAVQAQLDDVGPNYVTAAAPPPKTVSRRKFCSICGSFSKYTCVRCGSLYCSARCSTVHVETRCLAFLS